MFSHVLSAIKAILFLEFIGLPWPGDLEWKKLEEINSLRWVENGRGNSHNRTCGRSASGNHSADKTTMTDLIPDS
jgi:hypothetical protein